MGVTHRRRGAAAAAVPTAALLVAAVLLALTGVGAVLARRGEPVAPRADAMAEAGAVQGPGADRAAVPPGDPVTVRIPAVGVVAPLVPLGTAADGTLEVPRYEEAGWYAGGSRPGDPGPAVIAAHVDSTTGPAVFYRLEDAKPGDVVHVDYPEGTVTFVVRESHSFPKTGFPTDRVYGPTEGPELRLITCDGTFDRSTRSYRSNLVVWADAAETA
ncbi:MAG TPA: class F sortase [Acidimicrobiales bacterium]|nr:class F sortase [Acidimicrobiales bacterium]